MLLETVRLTSESEWQQLLPRALSWVLNGLLVVGLGTEMQVYSQWKEEKDTVAIDDSDIVPTTKIQIVRSYFLIHNLHCKRKILIIVYQEISLSTCKHSDTCYYYILSKISRF